LKAVEELYAEAEDGKSLEAQVEDLYAADGGLREDEGRPPSSGQWAKRPPSEDVPAVPAHVVEKVRSAGFVVMPEAAVAEDWEFEAEGGPCWFCVVHEPQLVVRSLPTTRSCGVATAQTGEVLEVSAVHNGWARLSEGEKERREVVPGDEAHALIDGRALKLGRLLMPCIPRWFRVVADEVVPVLCRPSLWDTSSGEKVVTECVALLQPGETIEVSGAHGGCVRMSDDDARARDIPEDCEAWVMIDGAEVEMGLLLMPWVSSDGAPPPPFVEEEELGGDVQVQEVEEAAAKKEEEEEEEEVLEPGQLSRKELASIKADLAEMGLLPSKLAQESEASKSEVQGQKVRALPKAAPHRKRNPTASIFRMADPPLFYKRMVRRQAPEPEADAPAPEKGLYSGAKGFWGSSNQAGDEEVKTTGMSSQEAKSSMPLSAVWPVPEPVFI